MKRPVMIAVSTLGLMVSLTFGYWLGQRNVSPADRISAAAANEPRVLYWFDPMMPDQHFEKPGKSPFMDMMLVPRYADEADKAAVVIDPRIHQNLGIRTELVELDEVAAALHVPGTLQWDLRGEQRISARVEGLIERLYVRAPFQRVRRGESLASLRAPTLGSALAEYHVLASGESAQARALQTAARARLAVLGLGEADLRVAHGAAPRVVLRAPTDGVLTDIAVREGDTVMAGQRLFQLNRTDPIWLEVRVPQADAGDLHPGVAAEVLISAFPGTRFEGAVEAVLPEIDAVTRTQGVRIVLPNADGRLAAGMLADAVLRTSDGRRCPWVPSEALILTGREARVIVQDADRGFRPVRVLTGRQIGERTEILGGLEGGEAVVASGQFLIDSEASLSGLLTRLRGMTPDTMSTEEFPSSHEGHGAELPQPEPQP